MGNFHCGPLCKEHERFGCCTCQGQRERILQLWTDSQWDEARQTEDDSQFGSSPQPEHSLQRGESTASLPRSDAFSGLSYDSGSSLAFWAECPATPNTLSPPLTAKTRTAESVWWMSPSMGSPPVKHSDKQSISEANVIAIEVEDGASWAAPLAKQTEAVGEQAIGRGGVWESLGELGVSLAVEQADTGRHQQELPRVDLPRVATVPNRKGPPPKREAEMSNSTGTSNKPPVMSARPPPQCETQTSHSAVTGKDLCLASVYIGRLVEGLGTKRRPTGTTHETPHAATAPSCARAASGQSEEEHDPKTRMREAPQSSVGGGPLQAAEPQEKKNTDKEQAVKAGERKGFGHLARGGPLQDVCWWSRRDVYSRVAQRDAEQEHANVCRCICRSLFRNAASDPVDLVASAGTSSRVEAIPKSALDVAVAVSTPQPHLQIASRSLAAWRSSSGSNHSSPPRSGGRMCQIATTVESAESMVAAQPMAPYAVMAKEETRLALEAEGEGSPSPVWLSSEDWEHGEVATESAPSLAMARLRAAEVASRRLPSRDAAEPSG